MASRARKLLQRILHLKEPFTGSSRTSRREVRLQWRSLQDVPECPASARTISSWGVSYRIMSPAVQSLLRNENWLVWEHLHAQWGQDFWTMVWCQEGQQRSCFSPRKCQRPTEILQEVQGLDSRRLVQSYFLWWSSLLTVWDIWKIDCSEKKRWTLPWVLCCANSEASWDHPCVGLLFNQGSGLSHNSNSKTRPWIKNDIKTSCKSDFFQRSMSNFVHFPAWWSTMSRSKNDREVARRSLHWNFGSVAKLYIYIYIFFCQ